MVLSPAYLSFSKHELIEIEKLLFQVELFWDRLRLRFCSLDSCLLSVLKPGYNCWYNISGVLNLIFDASGSDFGF